MYLTNSERVMLEITLFNLLNESTAPGSVPDMHLDLSSMTDSELEDALNGLIADL